MDNSFLSMKRGYIEVICGCMYSGKTEELIRQIKRCEYAKQTYRVFKPKVDNRYSDDDVTSHNQDSVNAIAIEDIYDIYQHIQHDTQVVGIDEAQFFNNDILNVTQKLAKSGRRVIIAGLDTDWQGKPFGPMPQLLSTADIVKKQYAICMTCGESATRTQRLVANDDEVLIGSFNMYEARCRHHFDPHLSSKKETTNIHELRPT